MARWVTERRLELITTVLLAVATVVTAWAAYQAHQWTGAQAAASGKATADRIAENRVAGVANRQVQIDVATFLGWLDARAEGRRKLAAFYRQRFRDEFDPAFTAWLSTRPFADPAAPATPFVMPAYRLAAGAEVDRLERSAATGSQRSKDANQRAENYMLAVVLLACALFFAGISTRLAALGTRAAVLALGCAILLAVVVWIGVSPIRFST
jgi:hypothetical protein